MKSMIFRSWNRDLYKTNWSSLETQTLTVRQVVPAGFGCICYLQQLIFVSLLVIFAVWWYDDCLQELDLDINPKPLVFILHSFLAAKVSRLGLAWNRLGLAWAAGPPFVTNFTCEPGSDGHRLVCSTSLRVDRKNKQFNWNSCTSRIVQCLHATTMFWSLYSLIVLMCR